MRHGGLRVEFGCLAERPQGIIAVEAVEERKTLVEEFLRLGWPCPS
jgi:hypothetical protein